MSGAVKTFTKRFKIQHWPVQVSSSKYGRIAIGSYTYHPLCQNLACLRRAVWPESRARPKAFFGNSEAHGWPKWPGFQIGQAIVLHYRVRKFGPAAMFAVRSNAFSSKNGGSELCQFWGVQSSLRWPVFDAVRAIATNCRVRNPRPPAMLSFRWNAVTSQYLILAWHCITMIMKSVTCWWQTQSLDCLDHWPVLWHPPYTFSLICMTVAVVCPAVAIPTGWCNTHGMMQYPQDDAIPTEWCNNHRMMK